MKSPMWILWAIRAKFPPGWEWISDMLIGAAIISAGIWLHDFFQKQEPGKGETEKHEGTDSESLGRNTVSLSPELKAGYKTLGCVPHDSDDKIKRCYRELVKEAHVDALPKDLPDYLVEAANKRFREIHSAYELVMRHRDEVA